MYNRSRKIGKVTTLSSRIVVFAVGPAAVVLNQPLSELVGRLPPRCHRATVCCTIPRWHSRFTIAKARSAVIPWVVFESRPRKLVARHSDQCTCSIARLVM